jgi:hypothetical protein
VTSLYAPTVPSTPQQIARRERVESVIHLAAPLLDLVLSVGERISRIAGPKDEYYPIRSATEAFELEGSQSSEKRERDPVGSLPDA